jgi:hypothetical protein
MQKKLKECDSCQKMTVIWKNHEGNRYCKHCWSCHKSNNSLDFKLQKPNVSIPRVSSKRKKKDAEYAKLRKRYLEENPMCKVHVKDCTKTATDIHHKHSGSERELYYLIQSTWLPVCRSCHNFLHKYPKIARDLNFLK